VRARERDAQYRLPSFLRLLSLRVVARDPLPTHLTTPHGEVGVAFDGTPSAQDLVVLGHGAGAGLESDFMRAIANGLARAGSLVCRFNFPYIEKGRRTPDRQPVLESTFLSVVTGLEELAGGRTLVIGGKSMGGRIAAHVAGSTDAAGLAFLGYPLQPPNRPERMRSGALEDVQVPMLFVAGTRDPLCPLPALRPLLERLIPDARLAVIEDGDHSFKVRRSSGRSTAEAWAEVVAVTSAWLRDLRTRETEADRVR